MPGKLRISRYPHDLVEKIYRRLEEDWCYSHKANIHITKAIVWNHHKGAINRPSRLIGRKPGRWDEDQWEFEDEDETKCEECDTEEHVVRREMHEVDILDVAHFRKSRRISKKDWGAPMTRPKVRDDREGEQLEKMLEVRAEVRDVQSEEWELVASDFGAEEWEEVSAEKIGREPARSYSAVLRGHQR